MQSILKSPYGLILFVLLFSGVEGFIWYYLGQIGFLNTLLEKDQSYISSVIIALYAFATLHFLVICYQTSAQYMDLAREKNSAFSCDLLARFYRRLNTAGQQDSQEMIEVLDTRIRSRYAFGFIIADMMLKLGILGTVIGFIIMLGSLSNLNSVDITVMQTLLAEMSGGMKVALFTTLAGMLAGIMLNIKYNLVDWAVDHLLNDIRESLVNT